MSSVVRTITTANSPYAPIYSDRVLLCDATAGPITVLLWLCAQSPDGWRLAVKKFDASANAITITPVGADQIDGVAGSVTLAADNDALSLITDRVGWWSSTAGATGPAGIAGATGPLGPIGLDGEDGATGPPGQTGATGLQGTPGSPGVEGPIGLMGPPGFHGEDAETFVIPGPQGPQGVAGGGGTATTVEVDLGATAVWRGKFTITDAAITGTSKVHAWQAPGPYTNKGTRADEAEMDFLTCIVTPAAGSATVYWRTLYGYTQGKVYGSVQSRAITALPHAHDVLVSAPQIVGKVRRNVKFTYTVA